MEEHRQREQERDPARPAVDPPGRRERERHDALELPHIRDAVRTWTIASTTAPVASHALPAMALEKTDSTRSACGS